MKKAIIIIIAVLLLAAIIWCIYAANFKQYLLCRSFSENDGTRVEVYQIGKNPFSATKSVSVHINGNEVFTYKNSADIMCEFAITPKIEWTENGFTLTSEGDGETKIFNVAKNEEGAYIAELSAQN